MAQPFKHPKTGIYYLRRKVPTELQGLLGLEFKRSLGTREPAQAKARFAEAWSLSETAFARTRRQLEGLATLTQAEAQSLANHWFHERWQQIEAKRNFECELVDASTTWMWEGPYGIERHTDKISLQAAIDEGQDDIDLPGLVRPAIASTLRAQGYPLPDEKNASYVHLRAAFVDRQLALSDLAYKRFGGDWLTLPPFIAQTPPAQAQSSQEAHSHPAAGSSTPLLVLFESYADEKRLNDGDNKGTRKTIEAYRGIVQRFIELCGDIPAEQIDRPMIARYRSLLTKMPSKGGGIRALTAPQAIAKAEAEGLPTISEATIRNQLNAVSAILHHGVKLGTCKENPIQEGGARRAAAKAAIRKAKMNPKRREYTDTELMDIFSSPIYRPDGWSSNSVDFGKAWSWLPLLYYYTGARREELAQLNANEVRKDAQGIDYIDILTKQEDDDSRGVKTASSRRKIPLHPDLIKLGFLDYVNTLQQTGKLFPKLKANPQGEFSANFGKHWTNYLKRVVQLQTTASPIHGFRHTFMTLSRRAGIPKEIQEAICGHAESSSVSKNYGSMPLEVLARELEKFPSAPIPALSKAC